MSETSLPSPWETPPPAYGPHLPGGILPLTLHGERRSLMQIPWRSVRHLHAALTHLIDRRHHTTKPDFSLIPTPLTPSGWALYLKDLEIAQALAGASGEARLGDMPVTIGCGSLTKLRTPMVDTPGRQRVCLTAETPVVIRHAGAEALGRNDAKQVYLVPVQHALVSTLCNALAERLGIEVSPADVALKILATETEPASTVVGHLNGHGVVRGWTGRVVMDVSPLGRWLLDCAERLGLGGRTAFGFGRVRVGSMALDAPPLGDPYPAGGRPEDRVGPHALRAWTALTGRLVEHAVADVEALRAGARFERIADNGVWCWRNGNVLLFVDRGALGEERVSALGAMDGSDEARKLARDEAPDPADETLDAAPRFIVSAKAVARYQARYEPRLSFQEAHARLQALTAAGRSMGPYRGEHIGKLPGAELWRGPKLGPGESRKQPANSRLRFVVAGEPGQRTVITVLPRRHEDGRG
jgi:hypothetical protein